MQCSVIQLFILPLRKTPDHTRQLADLSAHRVVLLEGQGLAQKAYGNPERVWLEQIPFVLPKRKLQIATLTVLHLITYKKAAREARR